MNKTTRYSIALIPLLLLIFVTGNFSGVHTADASVVPDPYTIYLTWADDPATTMIIHFHDYASNRCDWFIPFTSRDWRRKCGDGIISGKTGCNT